MGKPWRDLSDEERMAIQARGVLLGYSNFNRIGGYYWRSARPDYERIDVNTLEPLTDDDEVRARQKKLNGEYQYD